MRELLGPPANTYPTIVDMPVSLPRLENLAAQSTCEEGRE